jgi:two-component system response regulator HydG
LIAYDWPGNVRELQNCLERVMALGNLNSITLQDLPAKIRDHTEPDLVTATGRPDELITLDELERRYIRQVLVATRDNKTDAARILGIDRRSLYRRLHDGDVAGSQVAKESTQDN